jgi:6-phosphogluconolactonase
MLPPRLKPGRLCALAVILCLGSLAAGCGGVSLNSGDGSSSSSSSSGSSSSSSGSTNGGGGGISTPTFTYTLSGSVTGLATTAAGLVIQDGLGTTLTVASNGRFAFHDALAPGDIYLVSVQTQPGTPAQFCRVSGGAGVISVFDVTNVAINCLTTGKYLFTVNPYDNAGNGSLASFTIDPSSGALTAAAGSPYTPTELQPYYVAVDPSGQYIYVANSGSASISTDSVGSGGELTLDVSTASTGAASNSPVSIAIDSSYLYVGSGTSANDDALEVYTLNGGVLTPSAGTLAASTYPTGNAPYSLAVDSGSSLLFGASVYDGNLFSDSIGSGGALTSFAGSPFQFQQGAPTNTPYAVALYPGAKFLYVTDSTADTVSLYTYTATAAPTLVAVYDAGATIGLAPHGLTVDPTGSFLYVANSGSGTVSAFTINSSTGVLTPVAGSPFTASGTASPATPTSVLVDPSAQFAYVTNGDAGTISVFSIDFATGALTAVGKPVSTIIASGGPGSLAIE